MEPGRPRGFLSNRIIATFCVTGVVLALLMAVCVLDAMRYGTMSWPAVAALVVLLAAALYSVIKIWIPYQRAERLMRLFLDGYTLSSLTKTVNPAATPATRELMARMEEDMNSSKLLNLNKRQAQYLALQNQINPHFLYNTLESIRSEALIAGLDTVADMTEALSVFFRYTISKVENLVSVEEELQNCETYFRIQQYRFGSRLELSITCDPEEREELYRCRLPKLTLQPILENSIIHGTETKIGVGHLSIHLERTQKRLLIRVSDDGVGMDEATLAKLNEKLGRSMLAFSAKHQQSKGGVALVNVDNRIQLLFGEEYGLHIYSAAGVGTDVEIVLPLITSDRDVPNKEALQ